MLQILYYFAQLGALKKMLRQNMLTERVLTSVEDPNSFDTDPDPGSKKNSLRIRIQAKIIRIRIQAK